MTSGTSVNFNLQLGALPCETFCQWTRIISTLFRRKRHVKPEDDMERSHPLRLPTLRPRPLRRQLKGDPLGSN